MNLSISWAKPVMFLSHGANPSAITLTMGADAAVITARATIGTLRVRSNVLIEGRGMHKNEVGLS